jgi:hypothetical protein
VTDVVEAGGKADDRRRRAAGYLRIKIDMLFVNRAEPGGYETLRAGDVVEKLEPTNAERRESAEQYKRDGRQLVAAWWRGRVRMLYGNEVESVDKRAFDAQVGAP